MNTLVLEIAKDTLAGAKVNPHNFTPETLYEHWVRRIEWMELKAGGKAWTRELKSLAKSGWIAATQKTTIATPPSEETLKWGGFLGGELYHPKELKDASERAFKDRFGY